jgi:asparagine synthase (glutamine-hydrolysing)
MAEGMGALALLDVARGRVLLARDRFGVKPLYLWQARAGAPTWFGSELEPLLRARGRGGADVEGLATLLRWHRPGPTLPWADVRALPPRSAWSSDGRSPARERRLGADPLLAPRRTVAEAEAGRRDLAAALARGAGEAAETPVAPTLFLSGGLDSAAVAVAVRRNDVTALTGRFAPFGGALDESAAASEVAAAADLDHEVVDLDDADLLEDLPRVVRALELPVGGPGSLALWRLCARVRGRVVLTGTGGDELLGGYARVALALGRGGAWTRGYDALAARLAPQPDVAARVRAAHDRRADLEPLLAPDFARTLRALWAADDARALAAPREHDLTTALRAELEGTLPALLQVEDRVAAAHGLEARPVFCLGGLPAAALALPADEVVGPDGEGKRALRTLLAGRVPEGVRLERTKRGFPTPFARAARGAGRARALAWIEDERFAARGWWDVAACRARLDDEAPLHDRALFALLAVECWARLYLDGDVHALPPRGEPLAVPTR